jgi:hypothetical protein
VIKDQFKIGNKNYIILSEEQKKKFGFASTISISDVGPSITTITTSVDADLKGLEVYKYLPAAGEAVVAVKKDNEYRLFKFLSFDSYNNNQDEDVISYLELYGINSAADITKIQFIGHSDKAKMEGRLDLLKEITDKGTISEFYNYYSVIRNTSEAYFDKLFNYKDSKGETKDTTPEPTRLSPDSKASAPSDEGGKEVKGSPGRAANALNNSLTIRMYNQEGVYFQVEYYPNIGFISRHEVNKEFASFLRNYSNPTPSY